MRLKLSIKGKTRLHGRIWTSEEIQFLKESWEKLTPKEIAEKLDRTEQAIIVKAKNLGLPSKKALAKQQIPENELTLKELADILNVAVSRVRTWTKRRGLKCYKRYYGESHYWLIIKIDDFWDWVKDYAYFLDLDHFKPGSLGPEPEWLEERRAMMVNFRAWSSWTPKEREQLIQLVESQKYTLPEIARILKRTERTIATYLSNEGILLRPVPLSQKEWTPEEDQLLLELDSKGLSIPEIAVRMNLAELQCYRRLRKLKATTKYGFVTTMN